LHPNNINTTAMERVKSVIGKILGQPIREITPLSGGDISSVYKVHYADSYIVVKVNKTPDGAAMFKAEMEGLQAIGRTNTIAVPEVIFLELSEGMALLGMQYIPEASPTDAFWQAFARDLGALHDYTGQEFGWHGDNFIGSLPQINTPVDDWWEFYFENRINIQLRMAIDSGRLGEKHRKTIEKIKREIHSLMPYPVPSLIHGDLWSGNFICDTHQKPWLIDPAICYGDAAMDIAMSRLFGGFSPQFYQTYADVRPATNTSDYATGLYQLYYLLVHVNLFGGGYGRSVDVLLKHLSKHL